MQTFPLLSRLTDVGAKPKVCIVCTPKHLHFVYHSIVCVHKVGDMFASEQLSLEFAITSFVHKKET